MFALSLFFFFFFFPSFLPSLHLYIPLSCAFRILSVSHLLSFLWTVFIFVWYLTTYHTTPVFFFFCPSGVDKSIIVISQYLVWYWNHHQLKQKTLLFTCVCSLSIFLFYISMVILIRLQVKKKKKKKKKTKEDASARWIQILSVFTQDERKRDKTSIKSERKFVLHLFHFILYIKPFFFFFFFVPHFHGGFSSIPGVAHRLCAPSSPVANL